MTSRNGGMKLVLEVGFMMMPMREKYNNMRESLLSFASIVWHNLPYW